jgi:hypothetical protein
VLYMENEPRPCRDCGDVPCVIECMEPLCAGCGVRDCPWWTRRGVHLCDVCHDDDDDGPDDSCELCGVVHCTDADDDFCAELEHARCEVEHGGDGQL